MKKVYERTLLMGMECCNSIGWIFINTFLVAYFFKAATQDVSLISFYFMIFYGVTLGLGIIAGPMLKAGYRLMLYRLGLILNFLALSWIMLAGEKVVYHIGVCATLLGSAMALKAFSWNLMVSDTVSKKKMIKFYGFLNTANGVVKMVAPITLGYFLTINSMGKTILFLLCLTAIEWCLSLLIKCQSVPPKGWFNLKLFLKKTRGKKTLKNVFLIEFFKGFSLGGVLNIVITLYTIYLFQTDFKLGMMTSVFNAVSILSNFVFAKYCTYKRFGSLICYGGLLAVTAAVTFALMPNKGTFILYNLCFVSIVKIVELICTINMFNVSNSHSVSGAMKCEYFAVREVFLNLGRIFSFAMLTIGVFVWGFDMLKYYLVVLSVLMGAMGMVAYMLNIRLEDNNPTELVVVR